MTDEERQRQMDFILEQQAQFTVNMQKLEEADARAAKRIDRLERVMKLVIRAGLRERKEMRQSIKALIASQKHTDQRLDTLINFVHEGHNGKPSTET